MSSETEYRPDDAQPTCPMCGGSGEITHVDEEVGCQLTEPCWRCSLDTTPAATDVR